MRINEYRTKPRGLADLLLADSLVEDGILLQTDGSLLTAWEFQGPDHEASEPAHLEALVARLSNAMRLGSGWMIHCDVIRSSAPAYPEGGQFPDAVSALIDEERRLQFTSQGVLYRSRYFLALTWLPPLERTERVKAWAVHGNSVEVDVVASHIRAFKAGVTRFENVFAALVNARSLKAVHATDDDGCRAVYDDLLRYIHTAVTGKDHPIRLPDIPVGLADTVLATEDFTAAPRVGKKHIRVVAIDGLPKLSVPGILAVLDQLPIEYRWSSRALLCDPNEARTLLEKIRVGWRGLKRGWWAKMLRPIPGPKDNINGHAEEMELDAGRAEAIADSNEVQFCFYTAVIVLLDEDLARLAESARSVMAAIQYLGFGCRTEDVNAIEAWLGSVPGDGYANVRRVQVHTLNLADFLPLTSVWTGLDTNPSRLMPKNSPPLLHAVTTGETAFRFNLHVRDVGHSLLIGPTGSGKSTFLGLIAAQWFRYPGAQVFALDWDYSIWLLTHALGGRHYDLMAGEDLAFSPLRHLEDSESQTWAASWIEDLCQLNKLPMNPSRSNFIVDAVAGLSRARPDLRTLTDLMNEVQDADIKEALRYYTNRGPLGQMLDAEQDSLPAGSGVRMLAVETKALLESTDPRGSVPVLLYLFRRIEQRLDGSPTLILLDEGWQYLKHELCRDRLHAWLKTLRRKNAAVLFATQQISDIANSPIADTVFSQTATKILLPDADATNPKTAGFYQQIGLTDRELEMLRTGIPKREYYIRQDGHKRKVNLVLRPVAAAFTSVNSLPERVLAAAMMAEYPDRWQAEWLRHLGIDDWAELLDEQLKGEMIQCATA